MNRTTIYCTALISSLFTLVASCSVACGQTTFQEIASFDQPGQPGRQVSGVRRIELSPDHNSLITASYGSRARLFDLTTHQAVGKPIRTSGDGEVGFVDNAIAYTADWNAMRLWKTQTGEAIGDAIPHLLREDTIIRPAISPDGRYIATRSAMDTVLLWDVKRQQKITELKQPGPIVKSMRFSQDGRLLFTRAGRSLTVTIPATGERWAGPFPALRFAHLLNAEKLLTIEQQGEGPQQLVIRSTRDNDWPEIHRAKLPANFRRLRQITDDQVLIQCTNEDFSARLLSISLSNLKTPKPVLPSVLRAFDLQVTADGKHWIRTGMDGVSTQRFGEDESIWSARYPGGGSRLQLHLLGKDLLLIHESKGELKAFAIADGRELQRWNDVITVEVDGRRIALGKRESVEVWRVADPDGKAEDDN